MKDSDPGNRVDSSKPPFFNNWRQIYVLVIAILVVLIGLFYWFTVSFS